MKLSADCIRSVLLTVESFQFGESHDIGYIHSLCPEHSEEELEYCCLKLFEGGLLDLDKVSGVWVGGVPRKYEVKSIHELTWQGHQFLDSVRDPKIWRETKNIAEKTGAFTLNALSSIAQGVATAAVNRFLGLP